jgi:hypothetical protein
MTVAQSHAATAAAFSGRRAHQKGDGRYNTHGQIRPGITIQGALIKSKMDGKVKRFGSRHPRQNGNFGSSPSFHNDDRQPSCYPPSKFLITSERERQDSRKIEYVE